MSYAFCKSDVFSLKTHRNVFGFFITQKVQQFTIWVFFLQEMWLFSSAAGNWEGTSFNTFIGPRVSRLNNSFAFVKQGIITISHSVAISYAKLYILSALIFYLFYYLFFIWINFYFFFSVMSIWTLRAFHTTQIQGAPQIPVCRQGNIIK